MVSAFVVVFHPADVVTAMAMNPSGRDAVGQSMLAIIKKDSGMAGRMSQLALRKGTNGSANISSTKVRVSTLGNSTKGILDFY